MKLFAALVAAVRGASPGWAADLSDGPPAFALTVAAAPYFWLAAPLSLVSFDLASVVSTRLELLLSRPLFKEAPQALSKSAHASAAILAGGNGSAPMRRR